MDRQPKYLRPYQMAARLHGPGFEATLWNSRASQKLRFEVIAEIIDLRGLRVLDAGCGMGDLLAFLEHAGQAPACYVGIDALDSVIAEARRRSFATPADFLVGDLVAQPALLAAGSPEVIIISGTLNTLEPEPFYRTLESAWRAAGRAVVFNFLSTYHDEQFGRGDGVIRRMDPVQVLAAGLRHTRNVIVRHDYYQGHDCTMAWIRG